MEQVMPPSKRQLSRATVGWFNDPADAAADYFARLESCGVELWIIRISPDKTRLPPDCDYVPIRIRLEVSKKRCISLEIVFTSDKDARCMALSIGYPLVARAKVVTIRLPHAMQTAWTWLTTHFNILSGIRSHYRDEIPMHLILLMLNAKKS
jgi:hypothetical protein